MLLAVISEMAGVVAVQVGASRRYDGPMGKSDRAFAFGALALAARPRVVPAGRWLSGRCCGAGRAADRCDIVNRVRGGRCAEAKPA